MNTMKLKVVNSTIFLLALVSYGENASARFIESDPIGLNGGINTYAYAKENPLRYTDPFGLSPRDVAAITDNFLKNVVQMTNDGYRLQNGKLNNMCRSMPWLPGCKSPNQYKDCGEQTEYMNHKLRQGTYDATWFFSTDAAFGHAWGYAVSSDPNDPVITYDTRGADLGIGSECPTCHGWFGSLSDPVWGANNPDLPGRPKH